jgi:hypothetical protein
MAYGIPRLYQNRAVTAGSGEAHVISALQHVFRFRLPPLTWILLYSAFSGCELLPGITRHLTA